MIQRERIDTARLAVLGIVLLPTIFAVRGAWALAALMLIVLIVAYHRAPNFRRYRSKTKRFAQYTVASNVIGFIMALIVHFKPAWLILLILLWLLVMLPLGFWVDAEKDINSPDGLTRGKDA